MQSAKPEVKPGPSPKQVNPTRHGEFYINTDQLSVFLVQNSLFKVHRHILVDNSPVFRDMFALPAVTGEVEGDSDDHPIPLQGVTAQEFEILMNILYHGYKPAFHPQHAEWIAALSISHRFDFQDVHERAVHNLRTPPSEAEVVPLLAAAEKYGVDFKEMVDALKMIVKREAFLSENDLDQMSNKLISRVVQARESYKSRLYATNIYRGGAQPEDTAMSVIASIWGLDYTPPPGGTIGGGCDSKKKGGRAFFDNWD